MTEVLGDLCGLVAIIGRPNVGKSTLLNRILGEKISITSAKAQTTRHRILGIKTIDNIQAIYVDTPGLHLKERHALNRYMNRTVSHAIADVDVIVFVVDGERWQEEDELVLSKLQGVKSPVILAINKVDTVKDKARLLPVIEKLSLIHSFAAIVPLSARSGVGVDTLEKKVAELLPKGHSLFPDDQITDRTDRFLAAEIIREKLMRRLGEELPYALTVAIEEFKDKETIVEINALILVERTSQKSIVIGKNGAQLKAIGIAAREDMERLFGKKVMLRLWVKIKEGWSDDERALRSLGYD